MSEAACYRRRISRAQLEGLAQYMERYPALALAAARSRDSHLQSKRLWEKIARTLNRIDHSQPKSGASWARYWIDLKFKIRRKYSAIQRCDSEGTHCRVQLSPLEQRVVKILTDRDGNLLPTCSVHHQLNCHTNYAAKNKPTQLTIKQCDNMNINDANDDYLPATTRVPELISLPDSSDTKPNISCLKHDEDPIDIHAEKTTEELRRELLEFELRRQKELYEIEKQHRSEKHELEMSILMIKKQVMMRQLNKL
ncbi:uncharacterized protein LOC142984469 [Anticarsia gemmatalis]|uniref:uncharacterized protein LOC142984469 n=1 Tax=Anticarsia gemmatalis TaxID=129554 RepID=UPI003F764761